MVIFISGETIYIMWTRMGDVPQHLKWFPNHFVPLLAKKSDHKPISVSDSVSDVSDLNFDSHLSDSQPSTIFDTNISDSDLIENKVADVSDSNSDSELEKNETLFTDKDQDDIETPQQVSEPQPHRSFLSIKNAFGMIQSFKNNPLPDVPKGTKNNCIFVVDNSKNVNLRLAGQKSDFTDDCGVWDHRKGSTKQTDLIMNEKGDVRLLEKKGGVFYFNRKLPESKLDPQPEPGSLISIKRYHATLKRDNSYKKHVTWIESGPKDIEHLKHLAIIEYVGQIPEEPSIHGNSSGQFPV